MRILIVDDDKEHRYMLEVLFRGHGYEVESAGDGVEALEKALQNEFDMIIADILMPRMDGFQLCREVKKVGKLKNIPFVFYTATCTEPEDQKLAMSTGAAKFIVKPVEPDVLIAILEEVIGDDETTMSAAPKPAIEDEVVYLKEYNERLIEKLGNKMLELEKVNCELRGSEEKYRELIDNANDAIMVFEGTGYASFGNPKFREMTGYSIDESERLHLNELIHPDDLVAVTEYWGDGSAGKKVPRSHEVRLVTKTGKMIHTDSSISLIERENGTTTILAIMRDITERRHAEEALRENEQRFRQLVENIREVFWLRTVEDPMGFIYLSPSFEKVWGYECEKVHEDPGLWMESVCDEDREHLIRAREKFFRSGEDLDLEFRIARPDGSIRWIRARLFGIKDQAGRVYRASGLAEDITERKETEEQLTCYREELEQMVRTRTERIRELERQRAESEKIAATGRMAARIAHEINNPLAGIKNSFLLVKDAISKDHPYHGYVRRIENEIDRIARIVHRMFDLYSPGRDVPRKVPVSDVIRDVVALLQSSCRAGQIEITLKMPESPILAMLPAGYVDQVLFNVIQNSIEASEPGGVIEVAASVEHDVATIRVTDQGCGISEETNNRIFEPFFTTKDGTETSALGLGLSVSKSMVEAMGGAIAFESKPSEGTVFTIVVPLIAGSCVNLT